MDTTPKPFQLNASVDAPLDTLVQSNTVIIEETTEPAAVTTSNGILVINGEEAGQSSTINAGDTLAIKLKSANTYSTYTSCNVAVGGFETAYVVRTASVSLKYKTIFSQTPLDYKFSPESGNNRLTFIDRATGVASTIPVNLAQDDASTQDYVYVANFYDNTVYKINPVTKVVVAILSDFSKPYGINATYEEQYGSPTGYAPPFVVATETDINSVTLLGATGSSIYVPRFAGLSYPANDGFKFGTGDFTVECWFYPKSMTAFGRLITNRAPAVGLAGSWALNWNRGAISFSEVITGEPQVQVDYDFSQRWYHLAVSRKDGVLALFINGVRVASESYTRNFTDSRELYLGPPPSENSSIDGYFASVRIVKGTAIYDPAVDTFTPSASLEKVAGTQLLLVHNDSVTTANDASDNHLVPLSTATISNFSAFGRVFFDTSPVSIASQGLYYYVTLPYEDKVVAIQRNEQKITKAAEISLPANSKPFTIKSDGTFLWVSLVNSDKVAKIKIDLSSYELITVEGSPYGIEIDTNFVWVTNSYSNTLSKIEIATGAVTSVDCGEYPSFLTADASSVFVASFESGTIRRIDKLSLLIEQTIETNGFCYGIVTDANNNLWVSNYYQNTPSIVATIVTRPTGFDYTDLGDVLVNKEQSVEFTVAGIDASRSVEYYVPDVHGAKVYLNGELAGNSGYIKNGDVFKRVVTSPTTYNTPLMIPTLIASNEAFFALTTEPDLCPDVFELIPEHDLWIRTWVQSNTVTIAGVSEGSKTDLSFDDGYIVVNDVFQELSPVEIQNGDRVSFIAQARGPYGQVRHFKIYNSHGYESYWDVSTFALQEPPQSFAYYRYAGRYPAPELAELLKKSEFSVLLGPQSNYLKLGSVGVAPDAPKTKSYVIDGQADYVNSKSFQILGGADYNKQKSASISKYGDGIKVVLGSITTTASRQPKVSVACSKFPIELVPDLHVPSIYTVAMDSVYADPKVVFGRYSYDQQAKIHVSFSILPELHKTSVGQVGNFGFDRLRTAFPDFGGFGFDKQRATFPDFGGFGFTTQRTAVPSFGGLGFDRLRATFPDFGGFGFTTQRATFPDFGGWGFDRQRATFPDFGGFGCSTQRTSFYDFGGYGYSTREDKFGLDYIQKTYVASALSSPSFGGFGYSTQGLNTQTVSISLNYGTQAPKTFTISINLNYSANAANKPLASLYPAGGGTRKVGEKSVVSDYESSLLKPQIVQLLAQPRALVVRPIVSTVVVSSIIKANTAVSLTPVAVLQKSSNAAFAPFAHISNTGVVVSQWEACIRRNLINVPLPVMADLWKNQKTASFADLGHIPVKDLYHPSIPYQIVGLHIFHSTFERAIPLPDRQFFKIEELSYDLLEPLYRRELYQTDAVFEPMPRVETPATTVFVKPSPGSHYTHVSSEFNGLASSYYGLNFPKFTSSANRNQQNLLIGLTRLSTPYTRGAGAFFGGRHTSYYAHVFSGSNRQSAPNAQNLSVPWEAKGYVYGVSAKSTNSTKHASFVYYDLETTAVFDRDATVFRSNSATFKPKYIQDKQNWVLFERNTVGIRHVPMRVIDMALPEDFPNQWYPCNLSCLELGMFATSEEALADGLAHGFLANDLSALAMPSGCWVWITKDIPRGNRFGFVGGYISGG